MGILTSRFTVRFNLGGTGKYLDVLYFRILCKQNVCKMYAQSLGVWRAMKKTVENFPWTEKEDSGIMTLPDPALLIYL